MKPLILLTFFALSFFRIQPIFAEGYASVKAALWSKDEDKFILRYQSDFDTGSYDRLEILKVARGSGKVFKNDERFNDGDNKPSPVIAKELSTYRTDLQALPTRWLKEDPLTYAKLPWPHWPPQIGGKYERKLRIDRNTVTITLETYGDPKAYWEKGYRLFVKTEEESSPRVLASWERPKDFDESKAKYFALGAVGSSPSGRWISIFLRQFDQGFESSDAVPLPLFFTKSELLGGNVMTEKKEMNSKK